MQAVRPGPCLDRGAKNWPPLLAPKLVLGIQTWGLKMGKRIWHTTISVDTKSDSNWGQFGVGPALESTRPPHPLVSARSYPDTSHT